MSDKYHISNGKLVKCDANKRKCPLEDVTLPAKIENTKQLWAFFDNTKIQTTVDNLTTVLNNYSSSDENKKEHWFHLGETIITNKTKTDETKKEELLNLSQTSPYLDVTYQTLITSKLFNTLELDNYFFNLTPLQQTENFMFAFENWEWEKERDDKTLKSYLQVAENNHQTFDSSNLLSIGLMVSAVAKNAKESETIHKTAQFLSNINLYAHELNNGYNQDMLLNNTSCTQGTADLICSNLARGGCYTELAKALTTYKERTGLYGDSTKPQERLKRLQTTHHEISKTVPIPPFEGATPVSLKKVKLEETFTPTPLQTVLDSYQENHMKLAQPYNDNDQMKNYIKNTIRIARITASENYRRTLSYYYYTLNEIKKRNSYR